jgi:hypothetical protein
MRPMHSKRSWTPHDYIKLMNLQKLLRRLESLAPDEEPRLVDIPWIRLQAEEDTSADELRFMRRKVVALIEPLVRAGRLSDAELRFLKEAVGLNKAGLRARAVGRPADVSQPPGNLELILYLFDCDPLVGDLEERYRKLVKRLGKNRADLWYTKQVLTSIWPLLRGSMRRARSAAVVGVVGFALRFFGMGKIADELKRVVAKR